MAYGDSPDDPALRAAWHYFCDRLKAAGDRTFKDHNPADALHRADAFRFLTQNLGQAFDLALETKDTQFPALHAFCTPTRKLGGDAADFVYLQAWIDGQSTYRISGNRGTAPFFNIAVQGGRPERLPAGHAPLHDPFGDAPEANLFGHQMEIAQDGSFELHVGGPERRVNWLPTTPGSRKLFLRQGFDGWNERPATMLIERVGMDTPKPVPLPETMIAAMAWAGDFVAGLMADWPEWPYEHGGVDIEHVNAFPPPVLTGDDRKRGRSVANMVWQLADDEALVVTFEAHAGLWMLSNMGVFFNSMDYLYRSVSFTPGRTAPDTDGKLRLVLCHRDPLFHNWIDTQGFRQGNLIYRHMLGETAASLEADLIKWQDLAAFLPRDSKRVTPAERTAQMHERFRAIRRRYAF